MMRKIIWILCLTSHVAKSDEIIKKFNIDSSLSQDHILAQICNCLEITIRIGLVLEQARALQSIDPGLSSVVENSVKNTLRREARLAKEWSTTYKDKFKQDADLSRCPIDGAVKEDQLKKAIAIIKDPVWTKE